MSLYSIKTNKFENNKNIIKKLFTKLEIYCIIII